VNEGIHWSLEVVTAPTGDGPPVGEPVTRAAAKAHCNIEAAFTDDDDWVDAAIAAARAEAERTTRRQFLTATYDLFLDAFPVETIEVPRPPLSSVTSVKYYDTSGVQQTLTVDTHYTIDAKSQPARIVPSYAEQTWPNTRDIPNAVEVRFVCGYGAAAAVPADYILAMKQMIDHWYRFRGIVAGFAVSNLPVTVNALLGGRIPLMRV